MSSLQKGKKRHDKVKEFKYIREVKNQ